MAKVIRKHWHSELTPGLTRRDRRGCEYETYIPDALIDRPFIFNADVAADVAEAERAIVVLNAEASVLAAGEALARLLLRSESVASSKIEGLFVGGRRLMRAEVARELGEQPGDVTAEEILGNIDAMTWAVQSAGGPGVLTLDHLLEINRRLLAGTRLGVHGGRMRTVQNWIGGSDYNPCSAVFVPPPPEMVPELLSDLVAFCNEELLPAVAQAAMAHAQFETIHPFVDGNGRTGRALIHLVLLRRRLATRITVPVSLILAAHPQRYVHGLTATRYRGLATSQDAHTGCNRWVSLFASSCHRAVVEASVFEERILEIETAWRERLGSVRANSTVDRLLLALPGTPVVTVPGASELLGRSFEATNKAIGRLTGAGILRQVTVGRRRRAFEAPEVFHAFATLEQRMSAPGHPVLQVADSPNPSLLRWKSPR
ncbi:MAG: Fic family protein [Chloroflexota bacterium]